MISARTIYNDGCLLCEKVEHEMVRIGALYLCRGCFEKEFNVNEFNTDSNLGKRYYELLNQMKEKALKEI